MSYELEGKLHRVYDTEQKTSSFQAREFVVETQDGNYSNFIKFQCVQERVGIIDAYNVGDMVKVSFDLRGREWNDKYFTNLNAWRVESAMQAQNTPSMPDMPDAESAEVPTTPPLDGAFPSEDLPF